MYGVMVAISHEFYEICSAKAKKYFRQIDCYRQKGSKNIHRIYTVDCDTTYIHPDEESDILTGKQHYQEKINRRIENIVHAKDPNFKMITKMKNDSELEDLGKNVSKKLITYFKKMYEFYAKGNWMKAKKGLSKIIKREKDGPSMFLLGVMREFNYVVPSTWQGVREIE